MRIAPSSRQGLDLARVLLVHGELAPRLTLQTILQAGGYSVDVAGSASEALAKLETNRYELPPETRAEVGRRWGEVIRRYGYSDGAGVDQAR